MDIKRLEKYVVEVRLSKRIQNSVGFVSKKEVCVAELALRGFFGSEG